MAVGGKCGRDDLELEVELRVKQWCFEAVKPGLSRAVLQGDQCHMAVVVLVGLVVVGQKPPGRRPDQRQAQVNA